MVGHPSPRVSSCPQERTGAGVWASHTSLSSGCRSHTTPVSGSTAKKREASSPDTPNTRGSLSMSRASNWVTEEPGVAKRESRGKIWEVRFIPSYLAQVAELSAGSGRSATLQQATDHHKAPAHLWALTSALVHFSQCVMMVSGDHHSPCSGCVKHSCDFGLPHFL